MIERIEVPHNIMELAKRRTKRDAKYMVNFDTPLSEALAQAYLTGFIDCATVADKAAPQQGGDA